MRGTDNQNLCPPIMGRYTHWTFWGLLHASGSALFPALYVVCCVALAALVGSAIGTFSYGASIARGACSVWKVRSALLASLKIEMSRAGSCKIGRSRLRLGRSCIDGGVVLEHGGGGTVSVPALGWSANSSVARGGLVGDAFAGVIAGRLLSPSGRGEGGGQSTRGGGGSFSMGLRGVITRPVLGDDVLAAVCHALTNGLGGPTAQLQHVESLLHDEWERPLDVIIPSSGSQQYKLEARHLRDVYSEFNVTYTAKIVVYYWWFARTALSADWDVMVVAWVVRDSLWNVSTLPLGRRLVLAESWALRTLTAASIDMIYAPPLLVAQIYNKRNSHWVLRLLLVSPTRTFLCLVFDPVCNKPYIAGANTEELAIVNLIAEQEGIEARPQKRWDKFLGEFGSVAFAIAPLLHLPTSGRRCELPSCLPCDATLPFV